MSMAVVNVSLSDNGDQHHIFKFSRKSMRGIVSLGWLSSRYSSSGYSRVRHVVLRCPQPVAAGYGKETFAHHRKTNNILLIGINEA